MRGVYRRPAPPPREEPPPPTRPPPERPEERLPEELRDELRDGLLDEEPKELLEPELLVLPNRELPEPPPREEPPPPRRPPEDVREEPPNSEPELLSVLRLEPVFHREPESDLRLAEVPVPKIVPAGRPGSVGGGVRGWL